MKTSDQYEVVQVGHVSDKKLKKALKTGVLTLTASELKPNDFKLLLHPENAKKVRAAQKANRGVRLNVTHGEAEHDVLAGGSFWKSAWNFIRNNATPLLDIVKNVATPFVGDAVATAGRDLARSMTGKGIKYAKGSAEAKAHMAALRAKRKGKLSGASFRLS